MQERWQARTSPAMFEEARRSWKNKPQSWRKTSYDKNRTKRSVTTKHVTPYPEINVMLTVVAIGFICVAIVVLGGYFERKMRDARNARHTYHTATSKNIIERYEYTKAAMIDFHKVNAENAQKLHTMMQGKMDTLVAIYQDILKQHATNSPYPIRLAGGHFNEDFAIIARIMHWNVQWREDSNVNLMPSSFVKCPHDLPAPVTPIEWDRLVRKFYEESGVTLERMDEYADDGYAEILDVNNIGKDQLCITPVCIKPDLKYEGKETKCHYCNGICCNCENCKKYRAFFQIRTALINTGKVNHWDYLDARLQRQIQVTAKLVQNDNQVRRIMMKLYEKAKIDNPELPASMDHLKGQELRSKLRKIAVRMMEGPMTKLITSDERLNEMADELTHEVVEHFLEQHGIIDKRTTELMKWVTRNYHKQEDKEEERKEEEQEKTKGGSGVTVRFDCDTASLRQYMNEDNDISSELSESDNVNNTQAHNEQINDELSDLDE